MKLILSLLLVVGIFLFFIDRALTCPPSTIEYRYLPRTWNEQLEDNAYSKRDLFKTMYDSETGNIWLQSYQNKKLV